MKTLSTESWLYQSLFHPKSFPFTEVKPTRNYIGTFNNEISVIDFCEIMRVFFMRIFMLAFVIFGGALIAGIVVYALWALVLMAFGPYAWWMVFLSPWFGSALGMVGLVAVLFGGIFIAEKIQNYFRRREEEKLAALRNEVTNGDIALSTWEVISRKICPVFKIES